MRNPDRIPRMLALIDRIWRANPDMRLCQLIGNAAPPRFQHNDARPGDLYHLEDEELEARLRIMPLSPSRNDNAS